MPVLSFKLLIRHKGHFSYFHSLHILRNGIDSSLIAKGHWLRRLLWKLISGNCSCLGSLESLSSMCTKLDWLIWSFRTCDIDCLIDNVWKCSHDCWLRTCLVCGSNLFSDLLWRLHPHHLDGSWLLRQARQCHPRLQGVLVNSNFGDVSALSRKHKLLGEHVYLIHLLLRLLFFL